MEIQFTTVNIPLGKSYSVHKQHIDEVSVIHAHKVFELNLMSSGFGKRIVGNNISTFESGDLILIGPDLPHKRELQNAGKNKSQECLIVYISEALISSDLMKVPELESIKNLFSKALCGLAFSGNGVKEVKQQMEQLSDLEGIDSFVALIKLLKAVDEIEKQELLSLTTEMPVSYYKDLDQIKTIYKFVLCNIQDNIKLDMVAGLLNMAPGSFCRFFKKRTGKSFLQYVKDIRIGLASKMLAETEKPIAQICQESGYNNLANFNLYFKSLMKMTPSAYRKNYRSGRISGTKLVENLVLKGSKQSNNSVVK